MVIGRFRDALSRTIQGALLTDGRVSSEPRYDEIIPGVTKPSWALAGMVATHILQNFEKVKADQSLPVIREQKRNFYYDSVKIEFKDKKFRITVVLSYRRVLKSGGYHSEENADLHVVNVDILDKRYPFERKEQDLIIEAMKKACALVEEQKAAKALSEYQGLACDLINNLFGKKDSEAAKPEGE